MRRLRADPAPQLGAPRTRPLDVTILARMVLVVVAVLLVVGGASAAAASPIRQLTNTASESLRPAWSPDGTKIAFQRSDNGDAFQIYVMDANGQNARRLSAGNVDDRHPSWSPDGKTIAVDSGTSTQREIWLIDVASTRRTQLTRIGANASFPSWSPDGTRLAFYEYRGGAADLWTIGRDGKGAVPITHGLASEQAQQCTFACHSAAWSPHGGDVAYTSGDQTSVLVMPASPGGTATSVSPKGENAHFP
ncbi:MAG: PD40 domain-containing protein, partial [Chloroflexi bacterium]|nr:PD40 domain-containing protein [Chloroflexota bacterium]